MTAATQPARPEEPLVAGRSTLERVLVINPSSGPDGDVDALVEATHAVGVTALIVDPDGDMAQQLDEHLPENVDLLGMAGGDGSLGLVASRCLERDIPFVCIPFGTRNHFARDLGLDRNDPTGALRAFVDGDERRIDVGVINGRVFLNNATFGVYAEAIEKDEYRDAKIRTTWQVTSAALRGEDDGDRYQVTDPEGTVYDTPFITLIANNCYDAASIRGLGQRERLDEGVLQISVIDVERRLDLAGIVASVVRDDAARDDRVEQWTATSIEVHADVDQLNVGIDGEAACVRTPALVELRPRALRVRTPRPTESADRPSGGDAAPA